MKKNNRDTRELPPEEQYELRKKIVKLRERGKSNKEVVEGLNGRYTTHASTIWKKYVKGGPEAIDLKIRGRKADEKRLLTPDQETKILKIILKKTPNQIGLNSYLWTRDAIRLAIQKKFGVNLQIRTISDYLKRWGLLPEKPTTFFKNKLNTTYLEWYESDYPSMVKDSKKNNFEIHWADNICVKKYNDKTNHLSIVSNNSIYMISAISNQGKVRFMLYLTKITDLIFKNFLQNMIKESNQKVFLIFYNNEVDQSDEVYNWLKVRTQINKIELFFPPKKKVRR